MKRLLGVPTAVTVVALLAACGNSAGSTAGGAAPSTSLPASASTTQTPIFAPGSGPAGGQRVEEGPMSLVLSSGLSQHGDVSRASKSTSVSYVSAPDSAGKRVAIVVSWSNGKDAKTAEQEAQAFRGQLLDVEHVQDLRMVRVTWPGLREAYQFAYTDHNVSPAAESLVLMGQTRTGQYVSVTAKSPRALGGQLQVPAVCGSLRVHEAPSTV